MINGLRSFIRRWPLSVLLGTIALAFLVDLAASNLNPPDERVAELIRPNYKVGDDQFLRECHHLLNNPITAGGDPTILNNGDEIFPAMLDAIKGAKTSVCFETFVYWSGDIGMQFAEALAAKAREGVPVHVLVDWLGSKILDAEEEKLMREAGVELQIYRPMSWYHLGKMNHRTHRKIMVVDGTTGFTGGVGIADDWLGNGEQEGQWRDFHFRFTGKIVGEIQATFTRNWIKATGRLLQGETYFPSMEGREAGEIAMQCFHSSPSEGAEAVRLVYLLMIESAAKSLDISAAYFVPDPLVQQALIEARKRGVRIRVLVPGEHMDVEAVTRASREMWGDLLSAGIEIYRYKPSMFHCKAFIADNMMVSIGSANFDNRSFQLNDEMNVNVFDRGFAEKMTQVLEDDLTRSYPVSLEDWKNRPWHEKASDWFSSKFAPQL